MEGRELVAGRNRRDSGDVTGKNFGKAISPCGRGSLYCGSIGDVPWCQYGAGRDGWSFA